MTLDAEGNTLEPRPQKRSGTGAQARPQTGQEPDSLPIQESHKIEIEEFYNSEIPRLINFLKNKTDSKTQAEDIAQEATIQLVKNWEKVEHPKAWIYRVANNILYRKARGQFHREILTADQIETAIESPIDSITESSDIIQVLKELPERQRQVLAWTLAGYSSSEISEILEVEQSTVRSTIRHARAYLARRLERTRPGLMETSNRRMRRLNLRQKELE
ncbi:RNA polymerase sigma factor [Streptomyces microflavus]|uniref:RNA polymerase sigma factor n=1 Tax=Streptomyces microflavus TaxID=1919 RepID=UPI00340A445C